MREIKFRAWVKADEVMVYQNDDTDYCMICNGDGFGMVYQDEEWLKNKYFEVMQYTGLKDKNGREIYEGDIITNGDINIKYIVEWLDVGLKARQISNRSTIGLTYWQDSLEVIGNIYENPELLKGDEAGE